MATTKTCTRCQGTGSISIYAHVRNGVCFACEGSGAYITEKRSRRTHRTQIIHVAANALKEIDAEGTRNCFITRGDDIAAARTVAANAGIDDVVDRIDAALKQRGLQIGTGRQMAAQRETVASKT